MCVTSTDETKDTLRAQISDIMWIMELPDRHELIVSNITTSCCFSGQHFNFKLTGFPFNVMLLSNVSFTQASDIADLLKFNFKFSSFFFSFSSFANGNQF